MDVCLSSKTGLVNEHLWGTKLYTLCGFEYFVRQICYSTSYICYVVSKYCFFFIFVHVSFLESCNMDQCPDFDLDFLIFLDCKGWPFKLNLHYEISLQGVNRV